jgi:aspartate racemase
VGLLATTGTIDSGLYADAARAAGIALLVPDDEIQEQFVMEAVYGCDGIKTGGDRARPRSALTRAADHLIGRGAMAIIAGCTEIPLAIRDAPLAVPLVDPTRVLAESIVNRGYAGARVE